MPKFKVGDKIRKNDNDGKYWRKDDTVYKKGDIAVIKAIDPGVSAGTTYQFEDDAFNESPSWLFVEHNFDLAHIDSWKEVMNNE